MDGRSVGVVVRITLCLVTNNVGVVLVGYHFHDSVGNYRNALDNVGYRVINFKLVRLAFLPNSPRFCKLNVSSCTIFAKKHKKLYHRDHDFLFKKAIFSAVTRVFGKCRKANVNKLFRMSEN